METCVQRIVYLKDPKTTKGNFIIAVLKLTHGKLYTFDFNMFSRQITSDDSVKHLSTPFYSRAVTVTIYISPEGFESKKVEKSFSMNWVLRDLGFLIVAVKILP